MIWGGMVWRWREKVGSEGRGVFMDGLGYFGGMEVGDFGGLWRM